MEIETDSGTAEMKLRMIFLQKADLHLSFWLPTELVKTTIKSPQLSPRWQTLSTGAVNFCEGREQISSELFHRCLKERDASKWTSTFIMKVRFVLANDFAPR